MAMNTGENEQGLRKIIDLLRFISIFILLLHIYYYTYEGFASWNIRTNISDNLLRNLSKTGLFNFYLKSKLIALALLLLSLLGVKGRKDEQANYKTALAYFITGLIVYFISFLCLYLPYPSTTITIWYGSVNIAGYLLMLTGGSVIARVIKANFRGDVFNKLNQTFPQEERKLTNEYSFNFQAQYNLKGKVRSSWVSIVNPRRSVLIMGNPGSAKSWCFLEPMIRQQSAKAYAQFIYDFKYPDLTLIAYNHFLKNWRNYPVAPQWCGINWHNPEYSHRCNPIYAPMMLEMLDAVEAATSILLSMNKSWSGKQGDFWVESAKNLLAAVFWFLRKFADGIFCTIPHAIELLQLEYDKLFTILRTEKEVQTLLTPFISSFEKGVFETIDNQMASVRVPLGRLSSPLLYWILSGNDFTLDANNPLQPKIICLGNDPVKSEALAPILSLFCDRMNKIINRKGQYKIACNYDEFSSLRVSSIFQTVATGRGHDIVTVLVVQDANQLRTLYTKEEAEGLINMTGNFICGQVSGDSAKSAAERFPKIMQDRQSMSINSSDTSVSKSKQLDAAITPATISNLSSGEFCGVVADNPDQPIDLKAFHCKIIQDKKALDAEKAAYLPLPKVRTVTQATILQNYEQIKQDIQDIEQAVYEEILNDPAKQHLLVKK
jgi:hypothetical protein